MDNNGNLDKSKAKAEPGTTMQDGNENGLKKLPLNKMLKFEAQNNIDRLRSMSQQLES